MNMRPTSKLIDMLSKFEEQEEKPIVKRDGKTFVRWDSFRLEQRNKDIFITLSCRGVELVTLHYPGPVDFSAGDVVTIYGMKGEAEITFEPPHR